MINQKTQELFYHVPVAPEISKHDPTQRQFGGVEKKWMMFFGEGCNSEAHVTRHHKEKFIVLSIESNISACSSSIRLNLTPDELIRLAQRLIDAAYDIRANPASQTMPPFADMPSFEDVTQGDIE